MLLHTPDGRSVLHFRDRTAAEVAQSLARQAGVSCFAVEVSGNHGVAFDRFAAPRLMQALRAHRRSLDVIEALLGDPA